MFCILSIDSVEEDCVSDTDEKDELSMILVNENQQVYVLH